MREIKYRGISQANGNMVYGDLVINKPTLSYRIIEHFALVTNAKYRVGECHEVSGNIHLVHPETVGEFTGLKDKNGKEIYEGDVCKVGEHWIGDFMNRETNGKVMFDDGQFYIESHYWTELDGLSIINYGIEVMGTIHENPDLLK